MLCGSCIVGIWIVVRLLRYTPCQCTILCPAFLSSLLPQGPQLTYKLTNQIAENATGFIRCSKCHRQTCSSCATSLSAHRGPLRACPTHLTDEILESTMLENGWKRCPRCHIVVEKNRGCNNILYVTLILFAASFPCVDLLLCLWS